MTKTYPSHGEHATYDLITIIFHWLTAAIVVVQFSTAEIWELVEKGPLRYGLFHTHVAFGIALAAILALRIVWRPFFGKLRPVQLPKTQRIAADAFHYLLYFLMTGQIVLGFLLGWSAGNPLHFFDLFDIAALYVVPRELSNTIGELHDYVAWSIVSLAFLHAAAALFHHYIVHDGVLRSMTVRATDQEHGKTLSDSR